MSTNIFLERIAQSSESEENQDGRKAQAEWRSSLVIPRKHTTPHRIAAPYLNRLLHLWAPRCDRVAWNCWASTLKPPSVHHCATVLHPHTLRLLRQTWAINTEYLADPLYLTAHITHHFVAHNALGLPTTHDITAGPAKKAVCISHATDPALMTLLNKLHHGPRPSSDTNPAPFAAS